MITDHHIISNYMVATRQGKVREKYIFNVRELDNLSGKIDILKIVMESWDLSGKPNCT